MKVSAVTHLGRRAPLALLGLGLLATGCGTTTGSKAPPSSKSGNVILTAYRHTLGEGTAAFTLSESIQSSSGTTTITGHGIVNLDGKMAEMVMSIPGVSGSLELRMIEPEIYLKLPPGTGATLPSGKSWISMNLDTVVKSQFGQTLSQLRSASQSPTQTLSYLQAVSTSGVHDLGSQMVGGVSTTKYEATVDLNKVPATDTPSGRAAIQRLESDLDGSTFPIDVWIDRSNQVRQMSFDIKGPTTGTGPFVGSSVRATVGFSRFSLPTGAVTPPPTPETYDITSQVASGTSGG